MANRNAPQEDHELGGDLDRDEVERLLMEVQVISPFFRGFKDNIDMLAEALTVDRFEGGETILQEGEEGTWMGILLTGELEVVVNGGVVHRMFPGEIVGEMILWFGGVRQATVRAKQPGSVATILVSELQELSLQRPQVCAALGLRSAFLLSTTTLARPLATYCTPFRPLVATCDAQIAMQLMRVVGQGSVNNFLKLRATMLLKQPKMLEQLIPVFGLAKVSAAPPDPIAHHRPILRD